MAGELSGKTAIVTGGSQGIGECVALKLAEKGAHVVVVASSDKAKAQTVVDRIAGAGGSAEAAACDVRSPEAVSALVKDVTGSGKAIDILVNCAGVFFPTPLGETKPADIDPQIDINLKGTFNTVNAVAPHMKERKAGKIVNFSSVAGVLALGTYALYCASKAGVIMMTKVMAIELAPHGINVNAIAPGNTATPMNADIRTDPNLKGVYDFMASRTPSGRVYSTPEEMADMAVFLVSNGTRAMHGSTVVMDEGFSAGI